MKILILNGLYPHKDNKYAAPFIIKRLKQLINYNIEFDIFSIIEVDSFFVRLLKFIKRKEIVKKQDKICYENFSWKFINFKNSIFDEIKKRKKKQNEHKNKYEKLKKLIDLSKYDLVYCHKAYPTANYAKLIKEEFGIPYIVCSHGNEIHTNPFKNKSIAKKTADVLNFADHCVFVSNKLKEYAGEFGYNNDNYSIIPNGIDSTVFKRNVDQEKRNLIGFVGNLINIKGADRLPKIFYEIQKKISNAKFLVVGDGNLKEKLETEFKNYKINNVVMKGRISQEEVSKLMNEIKLLIVPSRNEGWPCVILEANACGCYVIGTNVGGIPEAIGEFGSIIYGNEQLEEKIAVETTNIINNIYDEEPLIRRTQFYTWENIVKSEVNLIKQILRNKNG